MGSSVAPPSAHRLHEQRAADDQRFLVGQQQPLAGARRGHAGRAGRRRRRWRPSPLSTSGSRRQLAQRLRRRRSTSVRHALRRAARRAARAARASVGQHRHSAAASAGTARAARRRADARVRPTTSKRSGWRATTSSVLVPTEPVEPRMARRWRCVMVAHVTEADQRQRQREHRQQRIDAVEHAAVAGQQAAAVLGAGGALDQRFDQVADHAHRRTGSQQRQRSADRSPALRQQPAIQARAVDGEARVQPRSRPAPARSTPAMPLHTPSQLLPGLMAGASLRLPKARPPK